MKDSGQHPRCHNPFMLNERDLAARWNISTRTLQRWRSLDRGPPWLLIEGTIRYTLDDVVSFEKLMTRGGIRE